MLCHIQVNSATKSGFAEYPRRYSEAGYGVPFIFERVLWLIYGKLSQ